MRPRYESVKATKIINVILVFMTPCLLKVYHNIWWKYSFVFILEARVLCFYYCLQPALSVPIHVVELTNVPPELRMNTGSPVPKPSDTRQVPGDEKDKVGIWKLLISIAQWRSKGNWKYYDLMKHTLIEKDHPGDWSQDSADGFRTGCRNISPSQDSNHPDDHFQCHSWVHFLISMKHIEKQVLAERCAKVKRTNVLSNKYKELKLLLLLKWWVS